MRHAGGRALRAGLHVLAISLLTSCALDINRDRFGMPLRIEPFEKLEPGVSDLGDSLDALGAPQQIVRPNDSQETHLWWLHRDSSDINIRFQLPVSVFGYRHNVFQYFQGDEQTNAMHLVFNDEDQLLQKELIVPEAYRIDEEADAYSSRWLLSPRYEFSALLQGDADFESFAEIFQRGHVLGAHLGYQPVAPLILSLGGTYQVFEGQTVERGAARFEFEDLELFTAEVLIRLQIPFSVFGNLFNYAEVRKILLAEDPRSYDGWLVYIEAGVGAVFNQDVRVSRNGTRLGDFFDDDVGRTDIAGFGVEYSFEHVSVRAGGSYRSYDAFSSGDSGLPDSADGLGAWLFGLSLSIKL